jgi:hypothetical protein
LTEQAWKTSSLSSGRSSAERQIQLAAGPRNTKLNQKPANVFAGVFTYPRFPTTEPRNQQYLVAWTLRSDRQPSAPGRIGVDAGDEAARRRLLVVRLPRFSEKDPRSSMPCLERPDSARKNARSSRGERRLEPHAHPISTGCLRVSLFTINSGLRTALNNSARVAFHDPRRLVVSGHRSHGDHLMMWMSSWAGSMPNLRFVKIAGETCILTLALRFPNCNRPSSIRLAIQRSRMCRSGQSACPRRNSVRYWAAGGLPESRARRADAPTVQTITFIAEETHGRNRITNLGDTDEV